MSNQDNEDESPQSNTGIVFINYIKVLIICTIIMYVILTYAILPTFNIQNNITVLQMFIWGLALMLVKFNPNAIHQTRISFHTFETQRLLQLILKNQLASNRLIQDVNHTIKTKE